MGGQATGTPLHPRPMGKHRPHAQLLADGRGGGGGERRFAPGVRAERPAGSAAGRERRGLCAGRAGCRGPETSPQVRPAPRCSPERHTLVRPERCPLRAGTWVPASGRTRTGWEVSREGVGGCRSPSAPGRREAAQGTLAGRCRHTCVCAAHTVPCHIAVTTRLPRPLAVTWRLLGCPRGLPGQDTGAASAARPSAITRASRSSAAR